MFNKFLLDDIEALYTIFRNFTVKYLNSFLNKSKLTRHINYLLYTKL